jgi:hypothetical protein
MKTKNKGDTANIDWIWLFKQQVPIISHYMCDAFLKNSRISEQNLIIHLKMYFDVPPENSQFENFITPMFQKH